MLCHRRWILMAAGVLVTGPLFAADDGAHDSAETIHALSTAAYHGNLPLLRRLVEGGADLRELHPNGSRPSALHSAVASAGIRPLKQIPVIRYLLDQGADVNLRDGQKNTPLMLASGMHDPSLAVIRLLLDRGADPDLQGGARRTALMYAVSAGNREVVRELLRRGCRVDLKNAAGQTALQVAYIRAAPPEILRMLKSHRKRP